MVVAALLAGLAAPFVGSRPAAADKISDKRAEAARIARAIDANGERISVLDEQINEANSRIAQLHQQIAQAQVQVEAADRVTSSLRGDLQTRAAALYRGGTNVFADTASSQANAAAAVYTEALSARDQTLIDNYRRAREDEASRKRALQRAEHDAETTRAALDKSRRDIESANAEEQRLYSKVKGELGVLIKQEQERQAALARERAQRALEAAAARARAAQAARDAATRSNPGDSSIGDPPPGKIVGRNAHVQAALDYAVNQLGKAYVYAGTGPNAFDCSGLTMMAWLAAGVSLPHNALAQYESLPHVPISAVQPGDLVFFGSPIHHVGMVVGSGTMIEAPHTGAVVRYASYYRPDIVGAARVP